MGKWYYSRESHSRRRNKKIGAAVGAGIVAAFFVVLLLFPGVFVNTFNNTFAKPVNEQLDEWQVEAERSKAASFREQEKEIIQLVNQERDNRGHGTLTWKDSLANVGREHSEWMASTGLFEHSGNQYYNCMGENIAMQTRGTMTPKEVVDIWMDSQGHRDAILWRTHIAAGAGIAQADSGNAYYTLIMDSTDC